MATQPPTGHRQHNNGCVAELVDARSLELRGRAADAAHYDRAGSRPAAPTTTLCRGYYT